MDLFVPILAFFGAFGFAAWFVFTVFLVGIIIGVENENYALSSVALIAGVAILTYLLSGWQGYETLYHTLLGNADRFILGLLIYAAVGIVWGVTKWFFYLLTIRDRLKAFREENGITGKLTDKQVGTFRDSNLDVIADRYDFKLPPRVAKSKGRIILWMIWWPFSVPWTLINQPVKRFFTFVYNRIAVALQNMSNGLFKGLA